jgi:hypothetical protein
MKTICDFETLKIILNIPQSSFLGNASCKIDRRTASWNAGVDILIFFHVETECHPEKRQLE